MCISSTRLTVGMIQARMDDQRHPDDIESERKRREWTGWRSDWERALITYPTLSSCDYAVGIEIARCVNAQSRIAYPSQELIALRLGRSLRAVNGSCARLARLRFFQVEKMGQGSGKAFNVYRLSDHRMNAALDYREMVADLFHTARDELLNHAASWRRFALQLVKPVEPDKQDLACHDPTSHAGSCASDTQDLAYKHLQETPSDSGGEKEGADSQDWTPRSAAS